MSELKGHQPVIQIPSSPPAKARPIARVEWAMDVAELYDISNTAAHVLLALARYARTDYGPAWPLVDTLARKCRLSRRTVTRSVKELQEAGLIEAVLRRKDTSSQYILSGWRTGWLAVGPGAAIDDIVAQTSETEWHEGEDTVSSSFETESHGVQDTESWTHGTERRTEPQGGEPSTRTQAIGTKAPNRFPLVTEREQTEEAALWEQVLDSLRAQVASPIFKTWLKDTYAVAMQESTLFVAVLTERDAQWLQQRMGGMIQGEVAKLSGQGNMKVEFMV